jgi:hypothetical protein
MYGIMNTANDTVSPEAFYFLFGGRVASFLAHAWMVAFWD